MHVGGVGYEASERKQARPNDLDVWIRRRAGDIVLMVDPRHGCVAACAVSAGRVSSKFKVSDRSAHRELSRNDENARKVVSLYT